jgi:hypothetical protein
MTTDWCDAPSDPYEGFLDPLPGTTTTAAPIPYGTSWPHAGAWIDPWTKTVHLEAG